MLEHLEIALGCALRVVQVGQSVPAVVPRRREAVVDGDREVVGVDRFGVPVETVQDDTPVVPRVLRVRVDVDLPVVGRDAVLWTVELVVAVAELVPDFRVFCVQVRALEQRVDGFVVAIELLKRDPSVEPAIDRERVEGERSVEYLQCLLGAPDGIERDAVVDERLRIGRVETERHLVGPDRFLMTVEVVQQNTAPHPRIARARLPRNLLDDHEESIVEATALEVVGCDQL